MNLTEDQIQVVIEWMNCWEQLKDSAIPIRFKEDFTKKQEDYSMWEGIVQQVQGYNPKLGLRDAAIYLKNQFEILNIPPSTPNSKGLDKIEQEYFLTQDEVYYTFGEKKHIFCINTKSDNWRIDLHPEMYKQLTDGYDKFFYSEAKAKEYILMHKPCISLDEILDVWGNEDIKRKAKSTYRKTPLFNSFYELVQSKVKQ